MKDNKKQKTKQPLGRPGRRPKAPGTKPGRKYPKVIWLYVSPEEFDYIEEAATIVGDSRSKFAARAVMELARETMRNHSRSLAFEEDRGRSKKGA